MPGLRVLVEPQHLLTQLGSVSQYARPGHMRMQSIDESDGKASAMPEKSILILPPQPLLGAAPSAIQQGHLGAA